MFSGGIRNNGTISAGAGRGIFLGGIATGTGASVMLATVAGGITNSGRIVAGGSAPAVLIGGFAPAASYPASVTVETFSGGVRNTGTISAVRDAILVGGEASFGGAVTISSFSGGITNAGPISAGHHGIVVGADSSTHRSRYRLSPAASVNTGVITAASEGIVVGRSAYSVRCHIDLLRRHQQRRHDFGGIYRYLRRSRRQLRQWHQEYRQDRGCVRVAGIVVAGASTFVGAISNAGTIAAGDVGIGVTSVLTFGDTSAGGGITNSGTIKAAQTGIFANGDAGFFGGIANKGTISAGALNRRDFCPRCFQLLGRRCQLGRRRHQRCSTGIGALGDSIFFGGIVNKGTIIAHGIGINLVAVNQPFPAASATAARSGRVQRHLCFRRLRLFRRRNQ